MVAKLEGQVPGVPIINEGDWGRPWRIMLSFAKKTLDNVMPYTLISHTTLVRGRPTLKDVERFWNGPVHELSSMFSFNNKITSSHEFSNVRLYKKYENNDLTTDLTNCDAGMTITDDGNRKYRDDESIQARETNKQVAILDKAKNIIKRKTLSTRCVNVSIVINILVVLLVVIMLNTLILRVNSFYMITIIIVLQAIVNGVFYSLWSCMCLVEDMENTLNECDILDKVVNLSLYKCNDITVSINVEQFRSRRTII